MRKQCVPGPLLSFVGPGNEATIGHAPFPLMRSVRDQNFRKITVAGGSTGHIAVTTP